MRNRAGRDDDATLSVVCAAVLGAVFSGVALATYDVRTAASVAVGSTIAVANLLTMRAIVRALVPEGDGPEGAEGAEGEKVARSAASPAEPGEDTAEPPPEDPAHREAGRRGGVAWGVFALLKIFVLFGGIWILLTKKLVDPMPLVVGYGVLPLGIAGSALVRSLKPRR